MLPQILQGEGAADTGLRANCLADMGKSAIAFDDISTVRIWPFCPLIKGLFG
jgi:hypothetical protein